MLCTSFFITVVQHCDLVVWVCVNTKTLYERSYPWLSFELKNVASLQQGCFQGSEVAHTPQLFQFVFDADLQKKKCLAYLICDGSLRKILESKKCVHQDNAKCCKLKKLSLTVTSLHFQFMVRSRQSLVKLVC